MTVVCQFSSLLVRDLSLRRLSNHSDGTKRVSLICCQFIEAHGQYFLHHAYEFNLLQAQIDRINNQLLNLKHIRVSTVALYTPADSFPFTRTTVFITRLCRLDLITQLLLNPADTMDCQISKIQQP